MMLPMFVAASSGTTLSVSLNSTYDVTKTTIQPTDCYAAISVNSDGFVYRGVGAPGIVFTKLNQWRLSGSNSDYQVRWTTASGSPDPLSFGTEGVWESLTTTQVYQRNNTFNGYSSRICEGTLEIRMAAAPNTVLASSYVTLEAIVEL